MTEEKKSSSQEAAKKIDKKLLENPFVGSLVVPIAIVLVGALIIFGVTKMISTEHSYKDLVREMKSKTFGNKWVAALELSKVISARKVPDADIPWLVDNLNEIYANTIDHRTRDFVVVALGSLGHEKGLKTLDKALSDSNKDVQFHAIVSLASMPKSIVYDWSKVIANLESDDHVLVQATVLALSTHGVLAAEKKMEELLTSELGSGVRYAAATGLIQFQNENALTTIKEILFLDIKDKSLKLGGNDIRALKANILFAAKSNPWKKLIPMIEEMIKRVADDLKVVGLAKEVLIQLKK